MGSDERVFQGNAVKWNSSKAKNIKKEKEKQFALLSGEGRVILFREWRPHLCLLRGWVPHQWT